MGVGNGPQQPDHYHTAIQLIHSLRTFPVIFLLALFAQACQQRSDDQFVQTIPEDHYSHAMSIARVSGVENARHYIDSLYNRLSAPNLADQWRRRLFDANLAIWAEQYDRPLEIVDSLIAFIETPEHYASMQNYLALTYLFKGDYYANYLSQNNLAYTNYVRARVIGLDLDDACLIAAFDGRFALVLYRRQNYLDAADYFKKAVSNFDNCGNESDYFRAMARWTDDIAISYAKAGQYDSALVYHQAALKFIDEHRFKPSIDSSLVDLSKGVIYGNLAQTLIALGKTDEAEPLLVKSIQISSRPGFENNDANLTRIHYAALLMSQGRYSEVKPLLEEVESLNATIDNETTQARLLEVRSRFLQREGRYQEALDDRLLYNQLQDSLNQVNSQMFDQRATNEYNYILNHHELERLQNENRIRSFWFNAGIIFALLLMGILMVIVYALRLAKINESRLVDLNNQILRQKGELESTVLQLKAANIEKDRIMWMVAHDLRNPLAAIEMLLHLLHAELTEPETKDMVNQMHFATKNAQKFIDDILMFSQDGRPMLDRKETHINELLTRTVEMMQFKAKEKRQNLVVHGLARERTVMVDPERITRALLNLVGNAIKFSPVGSEIAVTLAEDSGKLKFSVKDQGIGVPAEIRDAIFETFTKAKRLGTGGEKSFGLGLSIVRTIVEAHNGSITLEDNPGGGSIFTLEIPI